MKSSVRIALHASPELLARLDALQRMFAQACNVLSPMVQQTRCWNRVALHHMAYKQLRERFPGLGSQMVCNAIYSVSRTARVIYQHPSSPFCPARLGARPLPTLQFAEHAPVYFDRHTLSLKQGQVSLFTLDGRMRFALNVSAEDERRFRDAKLREIVLTGAATKYALTFSFDDLAAGGAVAESTDSTQLDDWPEYVVVLADAPDPTPTALTMPLYTPPTGLQEARP